MHNNSDQTSDVPARELVAHIQNRLEDFEPLNAKDALIWLAVLSYQREYCSKSDDMTSMFDSKTRSRALSLLCSQLDHQRHDQVDQLCDQFIAEFQATDLPHRDAAIAILTGFRYCVDSEAGHNFLQVLANSEPSTRLPALLEFVGYSTGEDSLD